MKNMNFTLKKFDTVSFPPNKYPSYDIKLWWMRRTSTLPLLPVPLRPGAVAFDWVLSMEQIELFHI